MAKIARFKWKNEISLGVVEDDTIYSLVGDLYQSFQKGGDLCQLKDVKLLTPVEPNITVACGANYIDHIEDMGWEVPEEPVLFFKPGNTIVGPGDNVIYPSISQDLRHESELCCVMKRQAKNVSVKDALDYVLGYTCGNDITARDVTSKDKRLTRSKGFDTSGPLGPFLVTDLDPHNLNIKGRVNGEIKQDSNTRLMVFNVERLISYISEFMTLRPGDVVWTGTPKGGACPIHIGDVIEVEIEGIGILRNGVIPMK